MRFYFRTEVFPEVTKTSQRQLSNHLHTTHVDSRRKRTIEPPRPRSDVPMSMASEWLEIFTNELLRAQFMNACRCSFSFAGASAGRRQSHPPHILLPHNSRAPFEEPSMLILATEIVSRPWFTQRPDAGHHWLPSHARRHCIGNSRINGLLALLVRGCCPFTSSLVRGGRHGRHSKHHRHRRHRKHEETEDTADSAQWARLAAPRPASTHCSSCSRPNLGPYQPTPSLCLTLSASQ